MNGIKKKLLFVCTAATHRSPTAASLFEDSKKCEAKYAGVAPHAKQHVDQRLIDWADEIFVFDEGNEGHKSFLEKNFSLHGRPVHNLGIPDIYPAGHPRLKQELQEKLSSYL